MRVESILQATTDALGHPLAGSRVLDLGCAEGSFAVEFARRGADVVAIEGRRSQVKQARAIKAALGLDRLEIVHDDVRNLSREAYGDYDVVLCLGILYHLDGPAAARLMHRVAELCRRIVVVETHVGLRARRSTTVGGHTYWGRPVREFDPGVSAAQQERLSRAAIGNPESLWLTRPSLYNLMADSGLTSVMELRIPRLALWSDRIVLVGFRGTPCSLSAMPRTPDSGAARWPERERSRPHPNQTWRAEVWRRLAPRVPAGLKKRARRWLQRAAR